jgi:nicotinate phosphoribosyltransferase
MISPLYTDQYTLTMAQSFWRHNQNEPTTFELFVRKLPKARSYLMVAGLAQAVEFLTALRFSDDDLAYLRSQGLYDEGFLDFLTELRFSGNMTAIAEGTVIAPQTPILRIDAPRIEATIIESALLTIINQQTMIATKASRIVYAAAGRAVWDFSLRRLHGPQAALGVARASYIAGAAGTATVIAGQKLGLPTTGTMAHHFILAFGEDNEQAAFEQFLGDYPTNGVLLIDTYDTHRGVERAISAAIVTGIPLKGVRLDSGDLLALSRYCRSRLDDAGMETTTILASNDLDEYTIQDLVTADAPIDAFGVGTMLGTSADAPSLGGVYKLVAQRHDGQEISMMKKAPGKQTDPGAHQVWRTVLGDVLDLVGADHPEGQALLTPVLVDGQLVAPLPTLDESAAHAADELRKLPTAVRALDHPQALHLDRSPRLMALRAQLGDPEALEMVSRKEVV